VALTATSPNLPMLNLPLPVRASPALRSTAVSGRLPLFDNLHNIVHGPERLGHASGHRRDNPQVLVNAHMVIMHEVDGQRVAMVLDLL
jgi:hypothetical protein